MSFFFSFKYFRIEAKVLTEFLIDYNSFNGNSFVRNEFLVVRYKRFKKRKSKVKKNVEARSYVLLFFYSYKFIRMKKSSKSFAIIISIGFKFRNICL